MIPSNAPTAVLVGRRAGALRAARQLRLRVVLLAERAPRRAAHPEVVSFFPCDLSGSDDQWDEIARCILKTAVPISFVAAVGERAVAPAAWLRAALGVAGTPPEAAWRCADKLAMKVRVRQAGLRCADFLEIAPATTAQGLIRQLGCPLVLKPRRSSGGRGTRIYRTPQEIPDPLPQGYLAERFVDGVEMSVESLVQRGRILFTNFTEYLAPRWANLLPAALPPEHAQAVLELNAAAIAALGVDSAITHLEVFLSGEGVVFGELAARPPGGHIMALVRLAYGVGLWTRWFEAELGRAPKPFPAAKALAGAWVLHPGPGTITRLDGVEAARCLPGVAAVKLTARLGDRVLPRLGVGQEIGHVLAKGPTREAVVRALNEARARLRIEVDPDGAGA